VSTAESRRQRRADLAELTFAQAHVLHRRQLYALGWTRWQVTAELRAGRWRALGRQSVATHTGPLDERGECWRAVFEVGPRSCIAGVSALRLAGLTGIEAPAVHVAIPKSSRPRRASGVVVHETRRLRPGDVLPSGLPRMRPAPAAVLAALWASSDRQAALYLVATVQQRLATGDELARAADRVRRDRRKALLRHVIAEIIDGVQALSELDFSALCRQRGLPAPTRQTVVTTSTGRCYLDVTWQEWRVAAEVDGVQHLRLDAWLQDAWRRNDVVLGDRTVLRFPGLAVRLEPDRVLDQTEAALRRAGWRPGAAAVRSVRTSVAS
jgi:hypothetical protein